ncbi:MAG: arginyltransferase [Rhizobiales bacterium]|nr:arginyltransferase [Hyphomicrobiales bacterium]
MTFYLTVEDDCAYLEGQTERKIFTKLGGEDAAEYFDELSQRGFRRSQNIAYIPACIACNACKSARLLVAEFKLSKSQKRVMNKNAFISREIKPAHPTSEQYRLFKRYITNRHSGGDMSEMGVMDYAKMIAESSVNTKIFEYYLQPQDGQEPQLVAVALTDIMSDGLSMVYSFFEPSMAKLSLGTYIILDHIQKAQQENIPHIYLGYYIDGCQNMEYKAKFTPQELFDGLKWRPAD